MEVRFTKHAHNKFTFLKVAGYPIKRSQIISCLLHPDRTDKKTDDTAIASLVISDKHILRVVFKITNDTILVITFYPGRRKSYGF